MGFFSRLFARGDERLRAEEPAVAAAAPAPGPVPTGSEWLAILDGYIERARWPEAVAVLRRLAADQDVETAAGRQMRAKHLGAAANILKYELKQKNLAMEFAEAALAADPTDETAHARLEKFRNGRR